MTTYLAVLATFVLTLLAGFVALGWMDPLTASYAVSLGLFGVVVGWYGRPRR